MAPIPCYSNELMHFILIKEDDYKDLLYIHLEGTILTTFWNEKKFVITERNKIQEGEGWVTTHTDVAFTLLGFYGRGVSVTDGLYSINV